MPVLKIKSIDPFSLARVVGIIGLGLGIVSSFAFWIWMIFVSFMVGADVVNSVGGFFVTLFCLPIICGILGAIKGFLIAKIYNFIAFSDRGLDFDVEIEPDHEPVDESFVSDESV